MPRVLMNFMHRDGWWVHFLAEDCRTPLNPGRYYRMKDEATLRDLAVRGDCEDMDDFERSLRAWGQGSVYLRLTEEQYRRLVMSST